MIQRQFVELYFTAGRVRPLGFLVGVNASRGFKFHKRSQLFIRSHNETVPAIAVRVSNEDRSLPRIYGRNSRKSNELC